MLYILALLAACVAAKGKKNLSSSLGGALQKGFDACEINAQIAAMETKLSACNTGSSFTVVIKYDDLYYMHKGENKMMGMDALMKDVKREYYLLETNEYFLTFKAPTTIVPSNHNFVFEVFNDADLNTAIDFARAYDFNLVFTLELLHDFRDPQMKQIIGPIGTTGDDTDGGIPKGRSVKFTKTLDSTDLKVYYHDNAGVRGNNKWCRWELQINGKNCAERVAGSMHTVHGEDDRVGITVAGVCKNIPATKKGEFHVLSVLVSRRDSGANCYTGYQMAGSQRGAYIVGQNFVLEAEEMLVGYQAIQYVQGQKTEQMDVGQITTSRQLTFNKVEDDTYMRIFWKDNLRKYGGGAHWCRWELRFDNENCKEPSHGIAAHIHAQAGDNDHFPKAVVGYCKMPRGEHVMNIWVNRNSGSADCQTGWGGGEFDNYLMEVREINRSGERITWRQYYNQADGRDHGYVGGSRTLTFDKLEDDTSLRMLWYDNTRVYGVNRRCQWEIYIDNNHCPSGKIAMSMFTTQNDNDYQPMITMGYCKVPSGRHTMRIYVHSNDGHNNHDCYTGYYWSTPNNWVMEVEETDPVMND